MAAATVRAKMLVAAVRISAFSKVPVAADLGYSLGCCSGEPTGYGTLMATGEDSPSLDSAMRSAGVWGVTIWKFG